MIFKLRRENAHESEALEIARQADQEHVVAFVLVVAGCDTIEAQARRPIIRDLITHLRCATHCVWFYSRLHPDRPTEHHENKKPARNVFLAGLPNFMASQ
ncbi:hypothetical protein QZM18_10850 [Burkholderia diffusa]|uniref:hypothetical protein n=1 Tax=Burkholderia diffusa TaxID=488732 RepID=UPI00264DBC2A|nr:hypothetical protein [Burkholderia diffusa]MDN7904619.1 hypothetical protein [Burkholderia diffusa]